MYREFLLYLSPPKKKMKPPRLTFHVRPHYVLLFLHNYLPFVPHLRQVEVI